MGLGYILLGIDSLLRNKGKSCLVEDLSVHFKYTLKSQLRSTISKNNSDFAKLMLARPSACL